MRFVFRNILHVWELSRNLMVDFKLCELGFVLERQRKFEVDVKPVFVNGRMKCFFEVR